MHRQRTVIVTLSPGVIDMSVCTDIGTQNLRFRLDAERALFFLWGWSTGMADFSLPSLVARAFTYVLSDGVLSTHVATCWVISFRLHGTQDYKSVWYLEWLRSSSWPGPGG